jgi:hypothetical protein
LGTSVNLHKQDSGGVARPVMLFDGSDNLQLLAPSDKTMSFRTGTGGFTSVRATITPTGRVGIGTTAPDVLLHLQSGDPGDSATVTASNLLLERNGDNFLSFMQPANRLAGLAFGRPGNTATELFHGGLVYNEATLPNAMQFRTGGNVTRMTIDANGDVGIGTTAPAANLHVAGDIRSDGPTGVVTHNPDNPAAVAFLGWLNNIARLRIGGNDPGATNGLDIQGTGDRSLMRILNNGNVGLGTTAPEHPLHIVSPVEQTLVVENTGTEVNAFGVLAKVASTTGQAIRGEATAATGSVYGVTGFGTNSPDGIGVWGRGNRDGVLGQSLTTDGVGVRGQSFIGSDSGVGVSGTSGGTSGTGVYGQSTFAIGSTRGVHGKVASPSGFAGFFEGRGFFSENVGIGTGTHSIDGRLHVESDNARVAKFDRYTSDGELVAFARNDGVIGNISNVGGVVSYNAFTGSHYGWSTANIAAGALVSMTGENRRFREHGDAEVVYGIQETARPNDPGCLGASLGLMESSREAGRENPLLVAAVGNGEMWIVDRGSGDIEPGDYLISSDVPGCAMKDDPAKFPIGHIVARAAERVEWSHVPRDDPGVRRARISVLFGSFVRTGSFEGIKELDARVKEKDAEIAELRTRLAKLELLVAQAARATPEEKP